MTFELDTILTSANEDDLNDLAALLVDAVDGGAAVSFLQPLSMATARAWWQSALTSLSARSALLVLRDPATRIVGSVLVQAAWAPNQPDRGEISKVLVLRQHRGHGWATALMQAAEQHARAQGIRLLTLDARAGGAAEALYRKLDWVCIGYIPKFALDADGQRWHDDVLFYKQLS